MLLSGLLGRGLHWGFVGDTVWLVRVLREADAELIGIIEGSLRDHRGGEQGGGISGAEFTELSGFTELGDGVMGIVCEGLHPSLWDGALSGLYRGFGKGQVPV